MAETPVVCSAQYGKNPDLCYRPAGHSGAHSNRCGCTWTDGQRWEQRAWGGDDS